MIHQERSKEILEIKAASHSSDSVYPLRAWKGTFPPYLRSNSKTTNLQASRVDAGTTGGRRMSDESFINLEFLKKGAKALLKRYRSCDSKAITRIRARVPRLINAMTYMRR